MHPDAQKCRPSLTMISMADHRDVPQYMDMPWLITCVIALTISVNIKYERADMHIVINQTVDGATISTFT